MGESWLAWRWLPKTVRIGELACVTEVEAPRVQLLDGVKGLNPKAGRPRRRGLPGSSGLGSSPRSGQG